MRLKTTKQIVGSFLLLMAVFSSEAQSTYLYFQNNTDLNLNVSATQFGAHVMDPGEWEANTTSGCGISLPLTRVHDMRAELSGRNIEV